jgi:hypothetical protein
MEKSSFDMWSPVAYFIALFLLSSSALLIHELSHIYAAEYITKDCIFTESVIRFDLLFFRRSGMTYFTCSHGVEQVSPPQVRFVWDDFTSPEVHMVVAKASGMQQISSPLTTGWFTALMGPALEIIYVAIVTDWISLMFKRLRGFLVFFLPMLVMIFYSSWSDFSQAIPKENPGIFTAAYLLAFIVIGMLHISFNFEYYKSLADG